MDENKKDLWETFASLLERGVFPRALLLKLLEERSAEFFRTHPLDFARGPTGKPPFGDTPPEDEKQIKSVSTPIEIKITPFELDEEISEIIKDRVFNFNNYIEMLALSLGGPPHYFYRTSELGYNERMDLDVRQITLEELGPLRDCEHCHAPTYHKANLTEEIVRLPDGITRANERFVIHFHGKALTLCATCRYNIYGGY